jgi:hypothetical protein
MGFSHSCQKILDWDALLRTLGDGHRLQKLPLFEGDSLKLRRACAIALEL